MVVPATMAALVAAVLSPGTLVRAQPSPLPASGATWTPAPAATPAVPPDAQQGLAIFRQRCGACHGPLGQGNGDMLAQLPGRPPSFGDPETMRAVTPAYGYDVVTHGRLARGMPPWSEALTEAERWDAVFGSWAFYLTPERLMRGRLAYQAWCAECHGAEGRGAANGTLADPAYMVARSQRNLFEATRRLPDVHASLEVLDAATLWSTLDYAWTFVHRALPHEALMPGGRLAGTVINGTVAGSGSRSATASVSGGGGTDRDTDIAGGVAGAAVRLVPVGDLMPGAPLTRTVGADGRFEFRDLAAGPGARYALVASHGGVDYISPEPVDLTADMPEAADVALTVYETAEDVPVRVRLGHVVVAPDPEAGVLQVTEVWVVANDSDRALVAGADNETLRFPLPPGLVEIRLEDARMRSADRMEGDTLIDTLPVPPGEREVIISYDLGYDGTAATLERVTPLDTAELRLLVPGSDVRVESAALTERTMRDVQGRPMVELSGRALGQGEKVAVSFSNLPVSSGAARSQAGGMPRPVAAAALGQTQLAIVGVILALLALAVALLYPALLDRQLLGDPAARLANERASLVREMAALDRRAAAGAVDQATYARNRARLLDRAVMVARRQG